MFGTWIIRTAVQRRGQVLLHSKITGKHWAALEYGEKLHNAIMLQRRENCREWTEKKQPRTAPWNN